MCAALLTALLMMALPALALAAQPDIVGVASVIDGDTIDIHGVRIRFLGIDAPEGRQQCQHRDGTAWRCGQQASFALSDHIGRATITCRPQNKDRYGRTVATCFKDAEDLNRWMVANGWAVAYRQYSKAYIAVEDAARRSQINIWAGTFDMPWDWRAKCRNVKSRATLTPPLKPFIALIVLQNIEISGVAFRVQS